MARPARRAVVLPPAGEVARPGQAPHWCCPPRLPGRWPEGPEGMPDKAMSDEERALNQPPPLVDYNVFEADAPLREALEREGAGWAHDWVSELGRLAGTEEAIAWGFQANENPPKLRTHARFGKR